jgi:glycosyltransferase involved in cell wall biosynthesis
MLRLVRDSELRGKLGRQGRQRVLRLYDSEVLINRHIELYRDLLSENCLKP